MFSTYKINLDSGIAVATTENGNIFNVFLERYSGNNFMHYEFEHTIKANTGYIDCGCNHEFKISSEYVLQEFLNLAVENGARLI